jgi:hypothetical protein
MKAKCGLINTISTTIVITANGVDEGVNSSTVESHHMFAGLWVRQNRSMSWHANQPTLARQQPPSDNNASVSYDAKNHGGYKKVHVEWYATETERRSHIVSTRDVELDFCTVVCASWTDSVEQREKIFYVGIRSRYTVAGRIISAVAERVTLLRETGWFVARQTARRCASFRATGWLTRGC